MRTGLRLVSHQARYDLLAFARDPRARFFTIALPVLFFLLFASIFSGRQTTAGALRVSAAAYYLPHLMALGVVAAGLVNLVIVIVDQRESGSLARKRATPVPAWALIAGRALTAVAGALLVDLVLGTIGVAGYGVPVRAVALGPLVLMTVVATAAFACLAYALSGVIGSAEAAQPVVQAVVLPLYFISGVFIPSDNLPRVLQQVAEVFPVSWLAQGLQAPFAGAAPVWDWEALGVISAWGAAGLGAAVWRFAWFPRST